MKSVIAAVALSLVAATCALPLNFGKDPKFINKDNLRSWATDFMLNGRQIEVGLGWKNDGTVAATAKVGGGIPLSAAITTNTYNLKKIEYEVGAKVLDGLFGAVYGDLDGALKYLVSAQRELSDEGRPTAVGVAVEGDRLNIKTVAAGVGYGSESIVANVNLDNNYLPESANVVLNDNAYDFPA